MGFYLSIVRTLGQNSSRNQKGKCEEICKSKSSCDGVHFYIPLKYITDKDSDRYKRALRHNETYFPGEKKKMIIEDEKLPPESMKALDLINSLQAENRMLKIRMDGIVSNLEGMVNDIRFLVDQLKK